MKRIPDCPGGMGNDNDWIKAREALGYPQNQTITYEYTTHSGDSDTLKLLQEAHRDARKYANDKLNIGFEWGYGQAIEDLQEILKSDRSSKAIKRILHKTKCPLFYRSRFFEITKIVQPESDNKGKNKKS